jgi:hypothetical protein
MSADIRVNIDAAYVQGEAVLKKSSYPNGSTALLLETVSGEPLAVATVALDELPDEGCVFIKDWSENAGILNSLQQNGIVGPVIRNIKTGFVHASEVKVLVPLEDS